MALGRRGFIRIAGTSAVLLAAGGGGGAIFALTREPSTALAPWREAGAASEDPRVTALSYAILAPNPHNRQPWLVDLSEPGAITLRCDTDRLLPETDPFGRQILIGLGCFLELLRMAAAEQGWRATITAIPDGLPGAQVDGRPVAHIRMTADEAIQPDPLFAHVLDRRSNKEPYDTGRPVGDGVLDVLRAATGDQGGTTVSASNDPDQVAALRDLTWRAHMIEMETPRTLQESIDLMRIGKAEILANPDGIDLGGPFLEALSLVGMLDRESLADPTSSAFQQGLDMYDAIIHSAMGYVWVTTPDDSRISQLDAGRDWVRINLAATGAGLAVHPLSQALQEYDEMTALFQEVHRVLAVTAPGRVQMLARLGYADAVPPSPRWPLSTRLIG